MKIHEAQGVQSKSTRGLSGYNVAIIFADNANEWNVSEWRALTWSDAFNRNPGWKGKLIHVSGFMDYLNPAIQRLIWPVDLIIYQRNILSKQAFDAMSYWQGMGKPVVIDLDDGYQFLPYSNPAREFWEEKEFMGPDKQVTKGGALRMLEEGLRRSNGLVSPNHLLLNDWQYITKNSYYLQNYARPEWWTDLPDRAELRRERNVPDDAILIGWGGSLSHYDSFWGSGIREAAAVISQRYPNVYWVICGSDTRILEQLPVPADRKLHWGGVPPNLWPRNVRAFDIGIAPLFGPYDQRRSWIKGIEYLLAGVPWAGTQGEPYSRLQGRGLLGAETPDYWIPALSQLVDNLPALQVEAEAGREQARRDFCVDNQLAVFADVFSRIKSDFSNEKAYLPGVMKTKGVYSEPESETTTAESQPATANGG